MSKARAPAVRDNIRVVNPDGDEGGDPIVIDEDGDECVVVTRGGRARAWHPPDIGAARDGHPLPASTQCDHGLPDGWRFGKRRIEDGRYRMCLRCGQGVSDGEPACGGLDPYDPGYDGFDDLFEDDVSDVTLSESPDHQDTVVAMVREVFATGQNDRVQGGVHPSDVAAMTDWSPKVVKSYFQEASHYQKVVGKAPGGQIRDSYVIDGADPSNSGLAGGASDAE